MFRVYLLVFSFFQCSTLGLVCVAPNPSQDVFCLFGSSPSRAASSLCLSFVLVCERCSIFVGLSIDVSDH